MRPKKIHVKKMQVKKIRVKKLKDVKNIGSALSVFISGDHLVRVVVLLCRVHGFDYPPLIG